MVDDSLLEFPCDFPIKVMGRRADDFQRLVFDIVSRHDPQLSETRLKRRDSRNGRYLSITVNVHATSQAQLDAIYQELSTHERVVMML